MRRAALALGLSGCARYGALEEACPAGVVGGALASADAEAFFVRVSCARRYAGLPAARVGAEATGAAEAHARYLARNGPGDDWTAEDPDRGGTGADVFERLEHQGFRLDARATWVRELLLPGAGGPAALADGALHDPLVRDVLLAPGWRTGGQGAFAAPDGTAGTYTVVVSAFPSGHAAPVVWPVDGQDGVPTGIVGLRTVAGAPQTAGYPITLTFGANTDPAAGDNPLAIEVPGATLTGPSGDVPLAVVLPGPGPLGPVRGSAILLPESPLEPDADYVLDVTVGWVGDPSRAVSTTFRTGPDAPIPAPL